MQEGWTIEQAAPSDDFAVVSQNGGRLTIVPLSLDTLRLPTLRAWSGSDTLLLSVPPLVVDRTMPDTLYTVSPFPAPAPLDIPAGLPEDYLSALRFWLVWGKAPRRMPVLLAAAAVLVLAGAAYALARARRRRGVEAGGAKPAVKADPAAAALALLDSSWFVSGDWKGLFREIDLLLRRCAGSRFSMDPTALTWRQISSRISGTPGSGEFLGDSSDLVDEIRLQRYAGWGSNREKAEGWVRRLAQILGRWHR